MALDPAHSEKRSFIRMRIDTPVLVRHGNQQFVARCKDLSGSGMLIASDQNLAVGDDVEVSIEQEGPNRFPFRATAKVSRTDGDNTGEFIIGLALTTIHE